jgi:hypothetical protein
MINFARSGGTILNRCLGSLPGVVIISEVSPFGGGAGIDAASPRSVAGQAEQWYGIALEATDFVGSVCELARHCAVRGTHLIVRDWTFASFVPIPQNGHQPPGFLATLEALRPLVHVTPFVFVRDAIDVWISRGMPEPESFFSQYLGFVRAIKALGAPIFTYEDFCDRPRGVVRLICDACGLPYDDVFMEQYKRFSTVSGDVQTVSRGANLPNIQPLQRKRIPKSVARHLNASSSMRTANELLGYPTSYEGRPRERLSTRIVRFIRRQWHHSWRSDRPFPRVDS